MSGRLRAYLELVRLPNTFTAAADVIAGFLFLGGGAERWGSSAILAGASACLYGGGAALNDVCDAGRDAAERLSRPIPSGRIGRPAAIGCTLILLAVGLGAAATLSWRASGVAFLLVSCIVLYDTADKAWIAAPAIMGLCRALNLLLGLTQASSTLRLESAIPVALIWMYVTSLTVFARREAMTSRRRELLIGTLGVCTGIAGLAGLAGTGAMIYTTAFVPIAVLAFALGRLGFAAALRPEPDIVQRTVKTFVLSLVLFDASLVWCSRGPLVALVVVMFLIPAALLSRAFRVT